MLFVADVPRRVGGTVCHTPPVETEPEVKRMQRAIDSQRRHGPWFLRRAQVASSVISLMAGLVACGSDSLGPSGTRPFVIRVDSIVAAPAGVGDTLTVTYHGVVGSNLCYALDRVEESQVPDSVVVLFHGVRQLGVPCEQTFSILTSVRRYLPPRRSPFTVVVRQPDGSFLRKTVLGL